MILNVEQGMLNDEYAPLSFTFLVLCSLFDIHQYRNSILQADQDTYLFFAFSLFLKKPLNKKLCCNASRSSSNF